MRFQDPLLKVQFEVQPISRLLSQELPICIDRKPRLDDLDTQTGGANPSPMLVITRSAGSDSKSLRRAFADRAFGVGIWLF
jgi:hypothetical protein